MINFHDKTVYLDTNIIIYLTEGYSEKQSALDKLLVLFEFNQITPYTSELTLLETLTGANKVGKPYLKEKYMSFLQNPALFKLLPVSRDMIIKAADIRVFQRLKSMDALHLASAISSGCDYFITHDRSFTSPDIHILFLDDLDAAY